MDHKLDGSGFDTTTSVQIQSSEVLVCRAAEIEEEGKVEMEGHRRGITFVFNGGLCGEGDFGCFN